MRDLNKAMKKLQEAKRLESTKLAKLVKESVVEPEDKEEIFDNKFNYKVSLDNGKTITATCSKENLEDARNYFLGKTYLNTKTGERAKVVGVEEINSDENGFEEIKNEEFGSDSKQLTDNDPAQKVPFDSDAEKGIENAATQKPKIVAEEFGSENKDLTDNDPAQKKAFETETRKEMDDATKGETINDKIDESKKLNEATEEDINNENKLEKAKQLIEVIFNMDSLDETRRAAKQELKDLVYPQRIEPEKTEKKIVKESIFDNDEETKIKEDRLADLRTQLECDGDQLADDEKEAIQSEINQLENELNEEGAIDANSEVVTEECDKPLKEEYSEKLGGDPEDFISDCQSILEVLNGIDTESFGTHLAQQMIEEWIEITESQIKMAKSKYNLEEDEDIDVDETKGVYESKQLKENIANSGDCTFSLKINCNNDAFGGEGDEDTLINETKRILNEVANKLDYTDKETILDSNGNKVGVYGFGFEGVMSPLDEAKQLNEGTKGKTLEVIYTDKDGEEKTTHFECDKEYELDGEQIREAIKSSDNDIVDIVKIIESCQNEGIQEPLNEEDCDDCSDDCSIENIDDETFTEAFTKFIKENYKNAKEFKLENVFKSGNNYRFECKLTFNSGKEVKVDLMSEATIKEGKSLIRFYENKTFKHLDENKSIMTATVKLENKTLSCEGLKYNYRVALKENKIATIKGIIK